MGGKKMKRMVMLIIILGFTLYYALPAMADGDVQATMSSSGNLKIIGDDNSNQIIVTNNGSGNIRVEGIDTTINGETGATDFTSTTGDVVDGKLDINLKRGDNYVEIDDIAVTRNLQLKFAHGDNTIGIFNTTVSGNASLRTGNGDNFIAIAGAVGGTWINNKLTIKTGKGDDKIEITECVAVGGKTEIKTLSGNDVINLRGNYFGPLTLDTGKGNDNLYISQYINSNRVNILLGNDDDMILFASTSNLMGQVTINGGKGVDFLIRDRDLTVSFLPITKSISVDGSQEVDDQPDTITTDVMIPEYSSLVRGGDPADISCPE
jgi:hypothetical protein